METFALKKSEFEAQYPVILIMCNSFCYEEFSRPSLIICVTWNGCIVFSENSCINVSVITRNASAVEYIFRKIDMQLQ